MAIARGCGQCLNFNPTLVVVLMLRRGLTWLRSTRLAFLFPLDQHIELHKLTGWAIFVYTLVHFVAHIVNFSELPWEGGEGREEGGREDSRVGERREGGLEVGGSVRVLCCGRELGWEGRGGTQSYVRWY